MTRIYGIDPDKKVTPVMVRGAIIKCFVLAHEEILEESGCWTRKPPS